MPDADRFTLSDLPPLSVDADFQYTAAHQKLGAYLGYALQRDRVQEARALPIGKKDVSVILRCYKPPHAKLATAVDVCGHGESCYIVPPRDPS